MILPISELIAQNVLATVQSVNHADGYNYSLTAQRHARSGDKRAHLNAIIVQDDPQAAPQPTTYNAYEWLQPFSIGVYIIPPENDATPIDTYVNLICADIQKAVMVDRYRGANALDTIVRPYKLIADEALQYDLLVIQIDVSYRTTEIDPYVSA